MKNILNKLTQKIITQKDNFENADARTRNIIIWASLFAIMGVLFIAFSSASPLNK